MVALISLDCFLQRQIIFDHVFQSNKLDLGRQIKVDGILQSPCYITYILWLGEISTLVSWSCFEQFRGADLYSMSIAETKFEGGSGFIHKRCKIRKILKAWQISNITLFKICFFSFIFFLQILGLLLKRIFVYCHLEPEPTLSGPAPQHCLWVVVSAAHRYNSRWIGSRVERIIHLWSRV